jgi:hypothetical protein
MGRVNSREAEKNRDMQAFHWLKNAHLEKTL